MGWAAAVRDEAYLMGWLPNVKRLAKLFLALVSWGRSNRGVWEAGDRDKGRTKSLIDTQDHDQTNYLLHSPLQFSKTSVCQQTAR